MERPQKRPRLGLSPHDESDDDDDELNYEPEEISQRRDPGARLARSRATAAFGLKSAFESIFARYERDFEGVADEIDLRTADVVVDNHHLERMRNERDVGNRAKETEEEGIPLRDGAAVQEGVRRAGHPRAPGGDEDEDQILQGKSQGTSSAVVRKGQSALVPRMSSAYGQQLGVTSHLGGLSQLPPPGASPLFFGSWGPPGAMDPTWQAPQIHQVPQFKSSFAANLFTARYQFPAREASKSLWAPGSHSDDEEDAPVETRKMRLAPPTRRVPARHRAMKLICAPPTNPDDSSDEDILMGVGASLVPSKDSNPSLHQRVSEMQDDEADQLLDRLERELEEAERGDAAMPSEPPPSLDPKQTAAKTFDAIHSSPPRGKKRSPGNKKKERRVSTPRKALVLEDESQANGVMSPAVSSPPVSHDAHHTIPKQHGGVVIELRPNSLLDDGSYLDCSDMVDPEPPFETSSSAPLPDGQIHPAPEDQHNHIIEEPAYNRIPYSDCTIPDSQETPASLFASSAPNAPPEPTAEKLPQSKQPEKKKSSVYDLSDEEVGFLARPPRKRKRFSDITSPPTASERPSGDATPATDAEVHGGRNRLAGSNQPSAAKLVAARDSPGTMFAPVKARSVRAKANPSGTSPRGNPLSDEAEDPARRLPRRRRLTPTSLDSTDDTEGEPLPAQARVDPSLPVSLVSPPPENGAAGDAEMVEEDGAFEAPEPTEDERVIPESPQAQRSPVTVDDPGGGRITRGWGKEGAGNTGPSSEDPDFSYAEPELIAPPPPDHQLPNESQDIINLTPHRERHARLPRASSSTRPNPATPSRTPIHKLALPGTPTSAPSTGHRSLTSLVQGESPDDSSEDELTSSSLWSLFKPTPTLTSSTKSAHRRVAQEETPTKPKRRVSALRLSSGFGAERPSAPNESVMRTPGGTIRKCGERGLKCGKDFCFTCC